MKNLTRILSIVAVAMLMVGTLTACGGGARGRRLQTPAPAGTNPAVEAPPASVESQNGNANMESTTPVGDMGQPTTVTAPEQQTATQAAGATSDQDTTGDELEKMLDDLNAANASADKLEDIP